MQRNYLYAVAIIFTALISVSTHVFILQYFSAPDLKIDPLFNQIIYFVIKFCTVMASVMIYQLSKEHWTSIKFIPRAFLFTVLMLALTEQLFRGAIMQIIVGTPWQYQAWLAVPTYLAYLSLSLVICFWAQFKPRKKFGFLSYILLTFIATAIFILISKITHGAIAPILEHLPNPPSSGPELPYGSKILIPAYMTYLEPAIASFVVFYLIEKNLPAYNAAIKGLFLGVIIILLHAGIYSLFQIACSTGNIFYRVFYYGQFLWEYLALGFFTAYSFAMIRMTR